MTRIDVSLVTLGDPDTLTGGYLYHRKMAQRAADHAAHLSFVSIPSGGRFSRLTGVSRRLEEAAGGDAVVLDSIVAAWCAPWLRRISRRVPVIGMAHQPPGGIEGGRAARNVRARLDRAAYRHMSLLMAASDALGLALREQVPGRRVVVVPPGRDAGPPGGEVTRGEDDGFDILCVGNWVPRKGILDLVDAFSRVDQPGAVLHLVGRIDADPAYSRRVFRALHVEKLTSRVVVHGPLDPTEMPAVYARADVFVLASSEEPYGTAYGEAMDAGLPVLGWHAGNLPFLAEDGREGFLLPEGDIGGLAAALARLATDEALRLRMGQAARRRAADLPDWDDTAAAFFGAIHRHLERPG
jgi:glycosyltransferase involved in cell wall biosynthesis